MADSTPKSYHTDPTLYLYTSLTAGSSHIISATSRLETILKANRIPFKALDVATDEKARMLWGRRAGKRKLPGLVRMGLVVGVWYPPVYDTLFPPLIATFRISMKSKNGMNMASLKITLAHHLPLSQLQRHLLPIPHQSLPLLSLRRLSLHHPPP